MNAKHLVVTVKEKDLEEFIDILDSKDWAVMDLEPRTKYHPYIWAIAINIIPAIYFILFRFDILGLNLTKSIIGIIIAMVTLTVSVVLMTISKPYDFTVVCEYIGTSNKVDMTPFDDTDDHFAYLNQTGSEASEKSKSAESVETFDTSETIGNNLNDEYNV